MKKRTFYVLTIIVFSACQRGEDNAATTVEGLDTILKEHTLELPYNASYNEATQKIELNQTVIQGNSLNVEEMLNAINIKYPKIALKFLSQKSDTIYVKIANAAYLGEQMGSSGSMIFLAEATFALTEIEGIKAVNFNFQEGDHAAPGTYTRNDFDKLNL
jgi:hypothetical protein